MVQLSPSGQSQINPFQLPRGEQIETPIELISRLGAGALNQMGQDRKREQQLSAIMNVLFPQGQAAAQTASAAPGGAAATPGFNPSAQPQGIGAQLGLDRDTAQQLFSQNPDMASQILGAVFSQRLKQPEQGKLQPVPGVPGAFFDPNNPTNVIFNDDLFSKAQDLKRAGANKTNVNVAGGKVETEFDKALGKQLADTRDTILKGATQANQEQSGLQAVESLLNRADVGPFAATKAQARIVADRLGIDVGDVSGDNATLALQSALARSAIDDLSRFPGQISEGERNFVLSVNPNVEMTRDQINELIRIKRKLIGEKKRSVKFMTEWQKKYGLSRPNEEGVFFDTAYQAAFGAEPQESLPKEAEAVIPDTVQAESQPIALPTGGDGKIDVAKLSEGQIYNHPKFGPIRWTGEAWEAVE